MDDKNLKVEIKNANEVTLLEEQPGWQYIKEWLIQGRQVHLDDLTSFKYVDDPKGYLLALARHNDYKDILNFIEGTIERGKSAQKELREYRALNTDE